MTNQKKQINSWLFLWKAMKGNRLLYVGAIISVLISAALSLLPPLIIGITIDSIIGDKPLIPESIPSNLVEFLGGRSLIVQNLWICGLLLILINLINGLFQYARGKWSAGASEGIAMNIRNELYDHIQKLPYEDLVSLETGDLIQRCTSDVETTRRFLSMQLVEMGRALSLLVFSLSFMISINAKMTLISVIMVPFIFGFSFLFFSKIGKAFKEVDEAEASLSTSLQENLTGIRVVRAFGRQAYESQKFDERNQAYTKKWYRLNSIMALYWAASDFMAMFQIGIVLVAGVYFSIIGDLSVGSLLTFMSYENMLLWPVRQLGRILTDMGKTQISLGRINEILLKPKEDMQDEGLRPSLEGDIEFKNVYFEYDENSPVLKDVSFLAKKGQTIAILGSTGSGKSSLVQLMQRLYDYQKGSISIGGVELKDISKSWLREGIGIVLQEPFLFSKTIKENISLAKTNATDKDIEYASKIASLHHVIGEFDKGYETMVGERGVTLSGGQKQRVAIARTLILNSKILIFDDSLSAVDTETDKLIREALRQHSDDLTTFIISHRVTTVSQADWILVLEDGKIAQQGSHDDLINMDGMYKRVWKTQSALEDEILTSYV